MIGCYATQLDPIELFQNSFPASIRRLSAPMNLAG